MLTIALYLRISVFGLVDVDSESSPIVVACPLHHPITVSIERIADTHLCTLYQE